jgi:hypothetical protein
LPRCLLAIRQRRPLLLPQRRARPRPRAQPELVAQELVAQELVAQGLVVPGQERAPEPERAQARQAQARGLQPVLVLRQVPAPRQAQPLRGLQPRQRALQGLLQGLVLPRQ